MQSFGLTWVSLPQLFGWREALDVLLIGLGIFFAYRTLRRLGTWRIFAGILVAVAVFLAASFLDLKGIEWIYSNLSHVVLIALIVLFQPELRKFFERAASLARGESGGDGDLTRLIAGATFTLAGQRRGALLVLPGREPVAAWTSGGTRAEAWLSPHLLLSIFDPHSPGHDGAVIIENGKVTHFGVRLPVSRSARLSEDYGTRHHAGMGLAEATDALVIAVSEERGAVTAFFHGEASPLRTETELAGRIASHWRENATYPFPGQTRREGWKFIPAAAASLLLALLFWSTVISRQYEESEQVVSVPVEYVAVPGGLALAGDKPEEVRLHLTGPRARMNRLDLSRLKARIDLGRATHGEQTVAITGDCLDLPDGVQLLGAEPASLKLELRQMEEREVEVRPQLLGELPAGLRLAGTEVRPRTVRVLTAAGRYRLREPEILTTPIYLEDIVRTSRVPCQVIAPAGVLPAGKDWPGVEVLVTLRPARRNHS